MKELDECISSLKWQVEQNYTLIDKLEQYSRREILEFLNIPLKKYYDPRGGPENPFDVIIRFLSHYLGIKISKRDISICHRQTIPSDKKKAGKHYIPPIYCRFLNRSLVQEILLRKHLLKGKRNMLQ